MTEKIATVRSLHASTALSSGEEFKAELGRWQQLIRSGALPQHVKTPEIAIALARYGESFGWDAMRAINNIYIVNGNPCIKTQAMLALALSRLPDAQFQPVTMTRETAVVKGRRSLDDEWTTVEFSAEDARAAGLTSKAVWKAYQQDMLYWRAVSRLCRRLFPDALEGMHSYEELHDAEWTERKTVQTSNVLPAELVAEVKQVEAERCDLCREVGGHHMDRCPHSITEDGGDND